MLQLTEYFQNIYYVSSFRLKEVYEDLPQFSWASSSSKWIIFFCLLRFGNASRLLTIMQATSTHEPKGIAGLYVWLETILVWLWLHGKRQATQMGNISIVRKTHTERETQDTSEICACSLKQFQLFFLSFYACRFFNALRLNCGCRWIQYTSPLFLFPFLLSLFAFRAMFLLCVCVIRSRHISSDISF